MSGIARFGLLINLLPDDEDDQASLQDFLQPLQDTADRVSKQVEDFARCLHKFQAQHSSAGEEAWDDARRLFEQFNTIASHRLSETRDARPRSAHDDDLRVQIQKLSLECDLWLLASNLLLSRGPNAVEAAAINQVDRLRELHQYSSNPDLWNAFLDSDAIAQEYETILVWLHERAASEDEEIRQKIAPTLARSNRGEMDSAVPVFTTHDIKQKKRLMARAGALDPRDDGLSSQLDPDAPYRQNAQLDPQDQFYEQASWQTCWEMLRGGRSLQDIRTWWTDAKEPYRAALCCDSDYGSEAAFDSPFLRMMNLATNSQWLSLCRTISRDPTISDPVKRAVFGVLSGDSSVSDLACENVDDMIFSLINALLVERYLHYVSAYRRRLEDPGRCAYQPLSNDRQLIGDLVGNMQSSAKFEEEMHSPHKFIEAALVGMDYKQFFRELGQGAAQVTYVTGRFDHLIEQTEPLEVSDCVQITASDADSVRIVVHLQLALQASGALDLKLSPNSESELKELIWIENNVASYIGHLQQDKKLSLIPLYASRLSHKRCSSVLGATMIDITDNKERDQLVRLMRKCDIDVADTLFAIAVAATDPKLGDFRHDSIEVEAQGITEKPPRGQTKIRSGFMSDDISNEEDKAILGVEWYRWVDAENWGKACFSISTLYKLWLAKGRFSALRSLAQRASLADVSLAALSMNLNFGSDQEDEDDEGDQKMDDSGEPTGVMSPRKRQDKRVRHPLAEEGTSREILYHKSSVWMQLEQLVNALQALEDWQELADTVNA